MPFYAPLASLLLSLTETVEGQGTPASRMVGFFSCQALRNQTDEDNSLLHFLLLFSSCYPATV